MQFASELPRLSLNCSGRTYLRSRILSRFSMSCGFVVTFFLIALRWRIKLGNSCLLPCASPSFRLSVAEMWTKMVQQIIKNLKKRRLSIQEIQGICEYFIADFEWSLYCFFCCYCCSLVKRNKYPRSCERGNGVLNTPVCEWCKRLLLGQRLKEVAKYVQSPNPGTLCVVKNPVQRPSSPALVLPAQWLEHPTGVTEVVCSISTWNS